MWVSVSFFIYSLGSDFCCLLQNLTNFLCIFFFLTFFLTAFGVIMLGVLCDNERSIFSFYVC
jgi:hypothetical protein